MILAAQCPDCGRLIELPSPRRGRIFLCPQCSAPLEVVQLDPPVLNWLYPDLSRERLTNASGGRNTADATEAHSLGSSSLVATGGSIAYGERAGEVAAYSTPVSVARSDVQVCGARIAAGVDAEAGCPFWQTRSVAG